MAELVGGRFRVGRLIGSGGQGRVVAATDELLDRPVALKILHATGLDGTARSRFLREARVAAGIVHPNVVTVFDVGAVEGDLADPLTTPYIAMELVEGPSLAQVLADRGPLAVADAVEATRQILAGLGAAHARGLVHRDVKPSNALLAPDGTVKLTDFGVATSATGGMTLTQTGAVLGSVAYLAPERVAGAPATVASDLYAVGVVLHELLAGEPPFTGDTAIAVAMAHGHSPVPSLTDRRSDVPPPLAALVARALHKDPHQRFADTGDMDRALAGTSPEAATVAAPRMATSRTMSPGSTPAAHHPAAAPAAHRAATAMAVVSGVSSGSGATVAEDRSVSAPDRPTRGIVRTAMIVVGGLLLVGVVAALVAASLGGGDSPSAAPGDAGAVTPAASPAADPATSATGGAATSPPAAVPPEPADVPAADAQPGTVDDLIALLAADPQAAGERGDDLLEELEDVRDADPEVRAREAVEAVSRARRWTRQGDLQPGVTAQVDAVLIAAIGQDVLEDVDRRGRGDEGGEDDGEGDDD